MTDPTRDQELASALAKVATPVSHSIRSQRGRAALAAAVSKVLPLVVVVPGIYFIFSLSLRSVGAEFKLSLWWVIGATLAYPGALLLAYWRRGRSRRVRERGALAVIDDELGLKDRFSTAHEFLASDERSSFMDAAIDDARNRVAEAREAQVVLTAPAINWQPRQFAWVVGAAILIVMGALIQVEHPSVTEAHSPQAAVDVADESQPSGIDKREKKDRPEPEARKDDPLEDRKSSGRKDGGSEETPQEKKQSKGKVGLGKSAQAQSVGGQSSGEGAASAQAQPTKGGSKKKPRKQAKKKKESSNKKNKRQSGAQDEKESVASAGRGRGKGASRSPTASDWSSKDQIVTDEDEEFDEDEDVDDDEEESDARGGVQPNLRSRKPPVNRDLNIGFGGGKPPPFANGRGGPGLPKKQRGVAQLVLGVPFPDHITGQPNPGMTKVTQERIEPQAIDSKKIQAEARSARAIPMGQLQHRVLRPWMQDLVREFYGSLFDQTVKE